ARAARDRDAPRLAAREELPRPPRARREPEEVRRRLLERPARERRLPAGGARGRRRGPHPGPHTRLLRGPGPRGLTGMARALSGVLDAVMAGVVVLDADGRVELLNAVSCRILETSEEAARGAPVERLLGADHALARLARAALASGGSAVENACPIARRALPPLSADVSASALFGRDGRVDGVALMPRDSTIRQNLQGVVAEREAQEAFGRIAAGVAHEVKNPLGGIRGAAEILASRASDAKTLDAAELIVREVDRIVALVDDLM